MLHGVPGGSVCTFVFGARADRDAFGSLPRDLGPWGMPGCTQWIELAAVAAPDLRGPDFALLSVPLPNDPGLVGSRAYAQAFHSDPGLNRLGFAASNGLAVDLVRAPARPLVVMTYNIHHAVGTDGNLDLPRIAAVIARIGPDLVCLQEVDRNVGRSGLVDQIAVLASVLGMNRAFSRSIPLGAGEYGNGLLSRWPILTARGRLLPNLSGGEQRSVLDARIDLGTRSVRVLCTHLDHRSQADRLAQLAAIDALYTSGEPTVLAGDLNARPGSQEIGFLELAGWTDPVGPTSPPSPTFPSGTPTRRIDYVLFRPQAAWAVRSTSVPVEPVASDHRPAVADLTSR